MLHIGLGNTEFVPTSTPASFVHCLKSSNLSGFHLGCPNNFAWRVNLHIFYFTILGRGGVPHLEKVSISKIQSDTRDATFLHNICLSIPTFTIPSIIIFLYYLNLIVAQIRASLMGFGTTVHGRPTSMSSGNFFFTPSSF